MLGPNLQLQDGADSHAGIQGLNAPAAVNELLYLPQCSTISKRTRRVAQLLDTLDS